MLVIAAGMMRSGSTWQYNALRLLLQHSCTEEFKARLYNPRCDYRDSNYLIKCHPFVDELAHRADFILTCHRDIRDACASLQRFHPNRIPSAYEKMRQEFNNYSRWSQIADYDMRYEGMVSDPRSEVYKLAHVLQFAPSSVDMVATELCALRPPGTVAGCREDPTTLLWPNHITDGRPGTYGEILSPETLNALEAEYGIWLHENGYNVQNLP